MKYTVFILLALLAIGHSEDILMEPMVDLVETEIVKEPVAEDTAPLTEVAEPVVEDVEPIVEETEPIVEDIAPVVEEDPWAEIFAEMGYVPYSQACSFVPGYIVEYKVYTAEKLWEDAENFCRDRWGGNLARIPDKQTNNLIADYIISSGASDALIATGIWMGLNDKRNEGDYEWSNGGPFCGNCTEDYPWGGKEPNNNVKKDVNGQDCVQLRKKTNYKWDDEYCAYEQRPKGFICEIPVCSHQHRCMVQCAL